MKFKESSIFNGKFYLSMSLSMSKMPILACNQINCFYYDYQFITLLPNLSSPFIIMIAVNNALSNFGSLNLFYYSNVAVFLILVILKISISLILRLIIVYLLKNSRYQLNGVSLVFLNNH